MKGCWRRRRASSPRAVARPFGLRGLTPASASNRGPPCDRRLDVAQQPIAIAGSKGLPVFRTPKHSTNSLRIAATTICLGLRRRRPRRMQGLPIMLTIRRQLSVPPTTTRARRLPRRRDSVSPAAMSLPKNSRDSHESARPQDPIRIHRFDPLRHFAGEGRERAPPILGQGELARSFSEALSAFQAKGDS